MANPRFAGLVHRLAGGFLAVQTLAPRLASQFSSQQRCLISHAALGAYFRGLRSGKAGLTRRDVVDLALAHDLSSRNTASAFFAEALHYGIIQPVNPDSARGGLIEPAAATLWSLSEWYKLHLSVIDGLDGGSRAARMQAEGATLVAALEPAVAERFLACPLIRTPPATYAIFASVDEGGNLMDRLINGLDITTAQDEDRALTDVTSVSALARPFNISRTHTGRILAAAIEIGAIGWSGQPGRSRLWLSRVFRDDYARFQAAKLAIIDEAFRETTDAPSRASPPPSSPPAPWPRDGAVPPVERPREAERDAVPAADATVAARLDALPFGRMRLAIFAVLTLALFAYIAEVALGNALGAVFQAPPRRMTQTELSLFLAAIFAGGAVGAPAFGRLGDRAGRRLSLQAALLFVAIGSLGAAASQSPATLIGFRFLSGLGIGACPPLIAAYLADVMPPRRRGTMIFLCAGLAFIGAPAIIFLMRATSPTWLEIEGWRWALGSGAILATLAAALLALLPESPRWLAAAGRQVEAEAALLRFGGSLTRPKPTPGPETAAPALVRTGNSPSPQQAGRPLPLLCGLYALAPWATIGFPLMSGAVMIEKRFSISESVIAAGLIMFGPVIGNLLVAPAVDRIERRACLIAAAAAMAVLGLAFAAATDFAVLVGLGIAFAFCSAVYASVLGVYAAEIVPTQTRASLTSLAWGLGRLVSVFVPLAFFALLSKLGVWGMFGPIALALGLSAILIAAADPRGRTRLAVA
ncbi:MAG: MFS transporter [Beijerinckiaceae bacterium]|nr:MFS transporter [Beijerinckiaceae bacterium]